MKRSLLIFIGAACAFCDSFAQAPEDWKRLSDAKDTNVKGGVVTELGVWKSPDSELRVQVLQLDPAKNEQGVWNVVGGGVSGLQKTGQSPVSSEVLTQNKYLCFRLRGMPKLNGVDYCVDTYFVLANLHTYVVKAFVPGEKETGFSISGWDFGEPLGGQTETFTAVLNEIKARLDSGKSLFRAQAVSPTATPKDAKTLKDTVKIWTTLVDQVREHCANRSKLIGHFVDPDVELQPYLQDLAKNPYFDLKQQARLHPSYEECIRKIAALRGETFAESNPDPAYQFGEALGKYGVPLTVLGFLIRAWIRRVSRKTPVAVGMSLNRYYCLLLLKMSWRVIIVFVMSMFLVLLAHLRVEISEREAGQAGAVAFLLLLIVCPTVLFVCAWTQTKRRFAENATKLPAS